MLVDIDIETAEKRVHPSTLMILNVIGGGNTGTQRIGTGMYQISHFSFDLLLKGTGIPFEKYPGDDDWRKDGGWFSAYGVCDSPDQLIQTYPKIATTDRKFVVSFTEIRKKDQSDSGGWRWHKWGPYIGKHNPQHEYLYDEEGIESVWCYHIYEIF